MLGPAPNSTRSLTDGLDSCLKEAGPLLSACPDFKPFSPKLSKLYVSSIVI